MLAHVWYKAPSLAFSEFLGIVTFSPLFSQFPSVAFLGTIKGTEKSLEYPNRALDKDAYENLRNNHRVDYTLFEAYQRLKSKRGERDLADRCNATFSTSTCGLHFRTLGRMGYWTS